MRAPSGLGQGSEIYLVDRYNVFISAARFGRPRFPRGIHSTGIDAAVNGETGKGHYANYDGVAVLGAWRWIDELGVAIVAEMPQTAALAPSRRLAWTILTAGFISAGALAIGVLVLARRITSPLLAINRAARGVAAGDLTQHAPVATDDEVGMLARSFNEMTDQLRGLYGELADSAARFAKVFDASPMAIAITTFEEGRYVDVNPRWLQLIGRDARRGDRPHRQGTGRVGRPGGSRPPSSPICASTRSSTTSRSGCGRNRAKCGSASRRSRASCSPTRPACQHVQRRDRSEAHRARAAVQPGSAPAGAEARSDRPPRRRHRARLQQPADDHHRLQRHDGEPSAGRRRRPRRARGDPQGGPAGGGAHAAAPRVQPEAGAGAAHPRSQRGDRQPRSHAAAARGRAHPARDAPRHVARTRAGRSGADRAGDRQPGRQRARRDADRRHADDRDGERGARPHHGRPAAGEAAGSFVALRVRDTGTGMDAETRQRVFEPFFTTKPQGKGTGLGLATIYGIVQQSHGHIEIESAVGRGSAFTVFLPRAAGAAEPRPVAVPVRTTSGSETILVVEDEDAGAAPDTRRAADAWLSGARWPRTAARR